MVSISSCSLLPVSVDKYVYLSLHSVEGEETGMKLLAHCASLGSRSCNRSYSLEDGK